MELSSQQATMTRICEHCGAKTVSYSHTLSKGLVSGLLKFAKLGHGRHNLNEADLVRNQIDNFQKLKYFGLVCKAGDGPKSGIWKVTPLGWAFLQGGVKAPKRVRTYRAKIIETSDERVGISDVPHDPYYLQWHHYVAESKGREDGTQ